MEATYWHEKWAAGQIGFHNAAVHPMLAAHADALGPPGSRVFLSHARAQN